MGGPPVAEPSVAPPPPSALPTEQEIWIIAKEEASEEAEDVVVTGSHIRRSGFDLPAPSETIDELELEFSGTPEVGNVLFDRTYQHGVNGRGRPNR